MLVGEEQHSSFWARMVLNMIESRFLELADLEECRNGRYRGEFGDYDCGCS